MSILVVGEALVDVVTRPGTPETRRAGGSPFNVAIGLSRLGSHTTLATQIGADEDGDLLRASLHESRVDLVELDPRPARTATAVATIAADGSASYEFDLVWDPESLPDPAGYEAVHVGSIGSWFAPGADRVAELTAAAATAGIPVTFDPNIRLSIEDDPGELRSRFDAVSQHASVIKMSDEDAAALFPAIPLDGVAAGLASSQRLAVITRGSKGAILCADGEAVHTTPLLTSVVDTIGAGDSFMAALLAGMSWLSWQVTGDSLAGLGALAAGAAAITVGREGADPPRRKDVSKLLAALSR